MLEEFRDGDDSLMFREKANALIRAINSIFTLAIAPDGMGSIEWGDKSGGSDSSSPKLTLATLEVKVCQEIEGTKTQVDAIIAGYIVGPSE